MVTWTGAAWLALHDPAGDRCLRPRPPRPLALGRLLIIALAGTVPFLSSGPSTQPAMMS